jgi:hypothetical protein
MELHDEHTTWDGRPQLSRETIEGALNALRHDIQVGRNPAYEMNAEVLTESPDLLPGVLKAVEMLHTGGSLDEMSVFLATLVTSRMNNRAHQEREMRASDLKGQDRSDRGSQVYQKLRFCEMKLRSALGSDCLIVKPLMDEVYGQVTAVLEQNIILELRLNEAENDMAELEQRVAAQEIYRASEKRIGEIMKGMSKREEHALYAEAISRLQGQLDEIKGEYDAVIAANRGLARQNLELTQKLKIKSSTSQSRHRKPSERQMAEKQARLDAMEYEDMDGSAQGRLEEYDPDDDYFEPTADYRKAEDIDKIERGCRGFPSI